MVKAITKFVLLVLFSMVIFLTKYPGFNIHASKSTTTSINIREPAPNILGDGDRNDLYAVGAFSVFVLSVSCQKRRRHMEFGVFEFLLELMMDDSMDIRTIDGRPPNLWYMFGAYLFCFVLIIIRSYRDFLIMENENNSTTVGGRREGREEEDNNGPGQADKLIRRMRTMA